MRDLMRFLVSKWHAADGLRGKAVPENSTGWPDGTTVKECTGQCCEELYVDIFNIERDNDTYGQDSEHKLYDEMLIFSRISPEHGEPLFHCSFWDKDTRKCGIYDRRPQMCSKFPYTGACQWCGGRLTTEESTGPVGGQDGS